MRSMLLFPLLFFALPPGDYNANIQAQMFDPYFGGFYDGTMGGWSGAYNPYFYPSMGYGQPLAGYAAYGNPAAAAMFNPLNPFGFGQPVGSNGFMGGMASGLEMLGAAAAPPLGLAAARNPFGGLLGGNLLGSQQPQQIPQNPHNFGNTNNNAGSTGGTPFGRQFRHRFGGIRSTGDLDAIGTRPLSFLPSPEGGNVPGSCGAGGFLFSRDCTNAKKD